MWWMNVRKLEIKTQMRIFSHLVIIHSRLTPTTDSQHNENFEHLGCATEFALRQGFWAVWTTIGDVWACFTALVVFLVVELGRRWRPTQTWLRCGITTTLTLVFWSSDQLQMDAKSGRQLYNWHQSRKASTIRLHSTGQSTRFDKRVNIYIYIYSYMCVLLSLCSVQTIVVRSCLPTTGYADGNHTTGKDERWPSQGIPAQRPRNHWLKRRKAMV